MSRFDWLNTIEGIAFATFAQDGRLTEYGNWFVDQAEMVLADHPRMFRQGSLNKTFAKRIASKKVEK